MLSSLPFYLSSWMTPGWLVGSNTFVQKFVIKDLPVGGQIHRTPYLAGIFTGTATLVALRWAFKVLPCISSFGSLTDGSNVLCTPDIECRFRSRVYDIHVLLHSGHGVRSRIYSATSRNIRAKESCRGVGCPRRI
jgi:hypothetical protein